MSARFLSTLPFVVAAIACSSNDKPGGAPPPPRDTGVDAPPPLPEAQCIGQSLGLSRRVAGVPTGVQSIFSLTSYSVLQSPVPTGESSLVAQITGGRLELDWQGTIADGSDVTVTGGTLTIPADDPAPAGTFCVVTGTVLHKVATGGKIEFVVTEGDCPASSGDAGVVDSSVGDAGDASGPSTEIMKGCIVSGTAPPDAGDAGDATSDVVDATPDAGDGG